jgi:catechol 2,3-dioxygenase-like lactoylglutathione lyase family enzyme
MTAPPAPHASRPYVRPLLLVLLATFLIVSPHSKAQSSGATPPLAGIAHVAIRVHDLAAAHDFYNKLGFQEAFSLSKDGAVTESFIKINDHQFLELYPVTAKDPKPGFLHLCFEGSDLQAIHDDYANRGLSPTDVRKAGAGNLLFTMAGPEHQNIEYTQYLPGSLHSNDEGKHLDDDRVADRITAVAVVMQDQAAARDFYINQLNFKPIAGDPMFLHMPGDSGQEVEIAQSALGTHAHIILHTRNLAKSVRRLHKEQIPVIKLKDTVAVTDPDGNFIVLDPR